MSLYTAVNHEFLYHNVFSNDGVHDRGYVDDENENDDLIFGFKVVAVHEFRALVIEFWVGVMLSFF